MSTQQDKPNKTGHSKSFLDTSVLRPLLTGTKYYKEYLNSTFGTNRVYLNQYVLMEFRRSLYLDLLTLYTVLNNPTISTLGDAYNHLSNAYGRTPGTLLQTIGSLQPFFQNQRIDFSKPEHKQSARIAIAKYLKRLEAKLVEKSDTGNDRTHCGRALKPNFDKQSDDDALEDFFSKFNDVNTCRSKCSIDAFVIQTFKSRVEKIVTESNQITQSSQNKSFRDIAQSLKSILDRNGANCTCHKCASIGDAVIALSCPEDMILEHTDNSFNGLCRALNTYHRHLDSDSSVLNQINAGTAPTPPQPRQG